MLNPPIKERLARWLADKAGLQFAEDAPGAICRTESLVPVPAVPEDDPSPERIEAQSRFAQWVDVDPFPRIAPSLLNAADIDDYMRTTALVFPYRPDERKTASYPLRVGHQIAYWDPEEPREAP